MVASYAMAGEKVGEKSKISLDVDGHVQAVFIQGSNYPDGMLNGDGWAFDQFRPIFSVGLEDSPFVLVFEPNLATVGVTDSNWIRELRLDWTLNDQWKVSVGRRSNSNIRITPPPKILESVVYPRVPVNPYSYMFQVEYNIDKWQWVMDIGGNSFVPFSSDEAFSRVDATTRLRFSPTESFHVAGNAQLSEDFSRFIADFGWHLNERLFWKGAAYYANEDKDDFWGGYTFLGYRLLEDWEVHGMVDYRFSETFGETYSGLFGIRYLFGNKEGTDITLGYQWWNEEDNRALVRFRKRF